MRRVVKIAAAAYPFDRLACIDDFGAKLERWVKEAVAGDAELLVFPEYGGMELASLVPVEARQDYFQEFEAIATMIDDVDALHGELARRHGVYLLAGSLPVRDDRGQIVNRARLFGPEGLLGFQDKLVLTPWELREYVVNPGRDLPVFDTAIGRIGILVCYDAEFPTSARQLVAAGAEILLVPACTDTLAGYWRVRIASQARALEGQCFVVHASTVGEALWHRLVDVNRGAGGIYAPPDLGFPDDGVIAAGPIDQPGWTHASLDLPQLHNVRAHGHVRNFSDWPED